MGDAAVLARAADRYRAAGRFGRHYVSAKLRRDPVYADLLALAGDAGFGDVADVGCGRGQLGVALLEAGAARSVLGLDWNPAHLRQAQRAASGLAFRAVVQDLGCDAALPAADTVVLIDVLYQLDDAAQAALLDFGGARGAALRAGAHRRPRARAAQRDHAGTGSAVPPRLAARGRPRERAPAGATGGAAGSSGICGDGGAVLARHAVRQRPAGGPARGGGAQPPDTCRRSALSSASMPWLFLVRKDV